MWRQVVAQSPDTNAPAGEVLRYDIGWKALNTLLKSGRSLSGHERNCCFLNTRGGRFADISAAGDIDFADDGRILAVTDWDFDGDLDFWIANRTGPQARFLRNDHDNDNKFVAFKLEGTTCNRDAIGAKLELQVATDDHPRRFKTVRAGEGYLAQSSSWIHFGLGDVTEIKELVINWPDGTRETINGLSANQRYQVKQGAGKAIAWQPPQRRLALKPSKIVVPPSSDQARIVLIAPLPIPSMQYEDADGSSKPVVSGSGRARVVNLWATWCQPCIAELSEWKQHSDRLARSGLEVLMVNVDEPQEDRAAQLRAVDELVTRMKLPFNSGYATKETVSQFDVLQRAILRRQRTLPVPSSFMIDAAGNLRVIYKGPVTADQLVEDAKLLNASDADIVDASVPFDGIWLGQPAGSAPNKLAIRFVEGGFIKEAEQYIRQLTRMKVDNPLYNRAEANVLLGAMLLDQRRLEESAQAFQAALAIDPHHRQSHIELAGVLLKLNKPGEAAVHFEHALERRTNDPELRLKLGQARLANGETAEAAKQFALSAELRPSTLAHHNLGNALIGMGRIPDAIQQFDTALKLNEQFLPAANNLAWLLATNPDATLRDGQRAVELSERVCRSDRTTSNLETLAVAYAESGRFEDAIKTAQEAIRMSKAAGDLKTSGNIQKLLALFRQKKPFRDG